MAGMSKEERNKVGGSDDGTAKQAVLDRLSDSQIDEVLGMKLRDEKGALLPLAERRSLRSKRWQRWVRYNSAEKVRAEVNIAGTDSGGLVLRPFSDYTGNEVNLLNAKRRSLESSGVGFSVPRHAVEALDTQGLFDALAAVLPLATGVQTRKLIRQLARL